MTAGTLYNTVRCFRTPKIDLDKDFDLRKFVGLA
jgi:hypothetical protein